MVSNITTHCSHIKLSHKRTLASHHDAVNELVNSYNYTTLDRGVLVCHHWHCALEGRKDLGWVTTCQAGCSWVIPYLKQVYMQVRKQSWASNPTMKQSRFEDSCHWRLLNHRQHIYRGRFEWAWRGKNQSESHASGLLQHKKPQLYLGGYTSQSKI